MKIYRKDRNNLEKLPEGEVIICPSKPGLQTMGNKYYGEAFLRKYNAWGFVRPAESPEYFALYLSSPVRAVRYFAVIDEIVDPMIEDCKVEIFYEYEIYSPGKKVIHLKEPLIELNDEIPFEGRTIPTIRYTSLDKFIEAETTDDLW